MRESFDAYEYVDAMRQRWRVILIACVTAAVLAMVASLLIPKRYTATASIMIEPGVNDARTSTAVSPVYLESLKTYERVAASDTLFARAVERFHLRDDGTQAIESLKRRVLKVNKLRDTRILEISVTLPDPKLAQQVVQFLTEETVNGSRNATLTSDNELVEETGKQLEQARTRLENAREKSAEIAGDPVEPLRGDVDASTDLLAKMRQQLIDAQGDVAEYGAREKDATDAPFVKQQLNAAKARMGLLQQRIAELQQTIKQKSEILGRRSVRSDEARMEVENAQAAYETVSNRFREVQAAAGTRGERLRIIDPGIVPQRPSSPNVFLNVLAALVIAFIASVVFVSLRFAIERAKPARLHAMTR